ncbi:ComF family protein [Formicincola oecophyllae]|uniref:ComF family protein n=1 Tax=Formicincola oecophyllae TaxID=2558361 RepID=A0A4Y6U8Q0_9PROT|nr:ComF family protein [Formicincola oecophyllae]QDH12948.1 ComF family protein [Formicincola oecophyllae]
MAQMPLFRGEGTLGRGQGGAFSKALLVPVPLHIQALRRRGFNQSALIAKALAKLTGVELCLDALVRLRPTRPLEGLGRLERQAELCDVVATRAARCTMLHQRPVVLIDDVMTTGATAAACCQALKSSGAGPVAVLTAARVTEPGAAKADDKP